MRFIMWRRPNRVTHMNLTACEDSRCHTAVAAQGERRCDDSRNCLPGAKGVNSLA
jgi:hypothetical protein